MQVLGWMGGFSLDVIVTMGLWTLPRQSDVAPGMLSSHILIIQLTMAVKTPIVKKRTKPFKCAP